MSTSTRGDRSRNHTRLRTIVITVATLGLTLPLAACSSDTKSTHDDVASVVGESSASASAAGSGTSSSSEAEAKRPQIRLDTDPAEVKRLRRVYNQCLIDHGYRTINGNVDLTDHSAKAKAADRACKSKLPLPPPELDREKNPDYLDQFHAYVQCMKGRGAKIEELPNGEGWNYSGQQALPETEISKIDSTCQKENFQVKAAG